MKKKILIYVAMVAFLLIVAGVGAWYITKSEAFYPNRLKIGKFIAVNNTAKCYIYDEETDTFTGDYFTIDLKAKGFADEGGMRIGEDGHGSLVFNDEEISSDEMFVMFETGEEYGKIIFVANDVEIVNSGTSVNLDKTGIHYDFYYSSDFSELKSVRISQDGENSIIGYVGDDLEEAEELFDNLQ